MQFGLLLSQLPHVDESRVQYDAMLSLESARKPAPASFWQRLKNLIS
ncbi:hypothetical protein [Burkholderia oklahomensis]|uniref:Uncharacterized protein n=1 Tax=Burkholderia oklahomensis TaxID=342113 RepID=A0AAI8B690_9BURK|nr:hypothetical protein [Burkholderia oklahomensis]AIO66323.1 hypothetical protein DM82_3509 [Burkholderia oklahomensis]AJX30487.1 hypothetical protein BG90_1308 [Burkholderia oklahomensis C6786]MBI0359889.1 hypothetical protein [Burkholderia oklahomensis]MDN7674269.1 hypothetical protein [Burkholderia oklahomensis]QPS38559.1 hypothetical protein I6G57_06985 [Burkholderia oklahomensis]